MTAVTSSPNAPASKVESRWASFRRHLHFSWSSGVRELRKRFQESLFGGLWLILGPALLVAVYWAVFDVIVGVEFTDPQTGATVPFLAAFSIGFFLYLTLSELIGGATTWLRAKRRFLLESDLPVWAIIGTLISRVFIQYLFYIATVIAVCWFYQMTTIEGTLLYLVTSLLAFIIFAGVGVIFAYLGCFFGDVRELVPVMMRVLFYTSSITFPLQLVPESLRWIPAVNPLTVPVELMRDLLLWNGQGAVLLLIPLSISGVVIWAIAILFHMRLAPRVEEIV
ncbi:MAG: ABC transporter permease [Pannonibacter sp.]